ncbi:diguanylate cyclase (GGDEF)-like protein [Mycobacteroides chelonae]|nr:diguanylate cyclase (GGDEF)-like protein [Mycobacteroides chelonae]
MRNRQWLEPGFQYDVVTNGLRDTGQLGRLKTAIGVMCMLVVLLTVISNFNALGPHGFWPRMVVNIAAASVFMVGLCWFFLPWPSRRVMVCFVVWADLAVAIGTAMFSDSMARLFAIIYLGLIGLVPAYFLGRRGLVAHCGFALVNLSVLIALNVESGVSAGFNQIMYVLPILTTVVIVPVLLQAVIESTTYSILGSAVAANRDPLTGLLNRRGVNATKEILHRKRLDAVEVVVVLLDLDGLKELNDARGHDAGDATLIEVADMLMASTRVGEIAARIGGDEFLVVAFPGRRESVHDTIRRVSTPRPGIDSWSVSVGAAWQSTGGGGFDFEQLVRRADEALYQAKSSRGLQQQHR